MSGKKTETTNNKGPFRVRVTLQSISPALFNPMSEEVLEGLRTKKAPQAKTDWSPIDLCAIQLYREFMDAEKYEDRGDIGLPATNLFACLVEAGRRVQYDSKSKMSTKDSSLIPAFLSVDGEFIPFKITTPPEVLDKVPENKKHKDGWTVDKRQGRLQQKAGPAIAVCLTRPKIYSWEADVNITLDLEDHPVTEDRIQELFKKAGTMVGIGSFRPSCRGQFGRFRIKKWENLGAVEDLATGTDG